MLWDRNSKHSTLIPQSFHTGQGSLASISLSWELYQLRSWIMERKYLNTRISVSSGGLFSVRTPPTPPNHQLQWTPPTCMLNLQIQWTPIKISLYSFQICNSNRLQWTPMGISLYWFQIFNTNGLQQESHCMLTWLAWEFHKTHLN